MEGFRPLDSGARAALRVFGMLLILAGVACGLLWLVTYGAGFVEPGRLGIVEPSWSLVRRCSGPSCC